MVRICLLCDNLFPFPFLFVFVDWNARHSAASLVKQVSIMNRASPLMIHIPFDKNRPWANWGKTAHCQPEYSFYPRNSEELAEIVGFARENGKRIRAVGTGHSWSALVPTDEILVYIQQLNRVQMDLSDQDHPRVIVEAGATVKEVNTILEKQGYALPFNVVLESVRFGGLISTGSHGSGWNHQTLSDLVHSIELVSASGQMRKFERGRDSDEVMSAVCLSLGMFGLIYRMSLNVQKSWTVRVRDQRLKITDVLPNLQEWVTQHDNIDVFWWPFSDRFWVKQWDRCDGEVQARPRYDRVDIAKTAIEMHLYQSTLELVKRLPRLTPRVSPILFEFSPSKRDQIVNLVEAIHYQRYIEVTRMGCVEVAFKISPDFDNVKWAIQVVLDMTKAYAARLEYPINVTLNVRFIHNSDCLLSPAYGEGHTCYIEILSRTDQTAWERFSGEVAREWLTLPQACPHWAKEYQHIPGIVDHIRRQLGPNIERFNAIKNELGVDTDHRFINDTLRPIFL
jgi:hypothetical protein